MGLDNKEVFSRRVGTGGANEPLEVVTHGRRRFEFNKDQPMMQGEPVTATPEAPTTPGSGGWFFRDRGDGKSQFCVRFPSGVVQIVATEDE